MSRPLVKAEREARAECERRGCVLTPETLAHPDDVEQCTRCYAWYVWQFDGKAMAPHWVAPEDAARYARVEP